jgi:hypothetical protein
MPRDGAGGRRDVSTAARDPWELDATALAGRLVRDERSRPSAPRQSAFRARRLATGFAFVTIFFAGAALSAGADDTVVAVMEATTETGATSTGDSTAGETTTTEPEAADSIVLEPAPVDGSAEAPSEDSAQAPAESSGEAHSPPDEPLSPDPAADPPSASPTPDPSAIRGAAPRTRVAGREPETHEGGVATVWLHRALPDPTPRAVRLAPRFARRLRVAAAKADVHWALVLGVLRARGDRGRVPASAAAVQALAKQLAAVNAKDRPLRALRLISGRRPVANRAIALYRYNRAVGLRTLVNGLKAAKPRLERRVLNDERLDIYAGGRADIDQGRIDVRVLVLMLYLAEAHGQVTVSSLDTGHRLYSRPGVISAHVFGLAADIAGLAGKPIYGNQAPGGLTEKAVRNILRLPAELRPQQVISLLGLGGPSFPLGDHGDHIHVGY